MHNRFYSYLINKTILHLKQFIFQKGHYTEQVIAQSADQIRESFENNDYTFGFFINLCKVFGTIHHATYKNSLWIMELRVQILLGPEVNWQIAIGSKSDLRNTKCGVSQGSILGPLLFLVYFFFQDFKSYFVCRQLKSLWWTQK